MDNQIDPTLTQRIARVLDPWADGIRRHEADRVALLFTPEALFQGFDPQPGFGRAAVVAYYAKQPVGLSPDYKLVSVRGLGGGTIVAYAHVVFTRPDATEIPVYLTVITEPDGDRDLISHYHVSRIL
jgi:uncharacterized protein (TIGR02246 family)